MFLSFFLPQQHAKKINPGEALPSVLHSLWSNFLTKFSKSNMHNTIVIRRSLGKILPARRELPWGQTGYAVSWHPTVLLVGLFVCDTWISLKKGLKHESLILASLAREGEEDFFYLIQAVANTKKKPQTSPRSDQQPPLWKQPTSSFPRKLPSLSPGFQTALQSQDYLAVAKNF